MKLHFFPGTTQEDLKGFSELFLMIPFLEVSTFQELIKSIDWHNDGLFSKSFFNKTPHSLSSLEDCDYGVLPGKYRAGDSRISVLCSIAASKGKKVLGFHNDDSEASYSLPPNLILFRTSVGKSQIHPQERVFPALVADYFPNHSLPNVSTNLKIGYVGRNCPHRERVLNQLKDLSLKVEAQYTGAFWGTRSDLAAKLKAKRDFHQSLKDCSFALCMRGAGNFSYRLYEALSFGAVPLLIDTDTVLPFEKVIDWDQHLIKIKEEDLFRLPYLLNKKKFSPQSNRRLWESYFSLEGYSRKLESDI
jgi:hypothetical protein